MTSMGHMDGGREKIAWSKYIPKSLYYFLNNLSPNHNYTLGQIIILCHKISIFMKTLFLVNLNHFRRENSSVVVYFVLKNSN